MRRTHRVSAFIITLCLAPALALARGPDFDRDGYDDLAIGALGEKIGTTLTDAGLVNVLYGSSLGLDDPATRMTAIWQDVTDVEDDSAINEWFGSALAWGDFNGDCFDDLVIGVPGQTVGAATQAGALHVFYGSSTGLRKFDDHVLTRASAGVPGAPADSMYFGRALAAGDFNGDGRDDIAAGYMDDPGVMIIYGGNTGLNGTNGPGAHTFVGTANHQGFGFGPFAAGDFNCDGHEDLAIGDISYLIGTDEVGRVDIIYGSSSGLSTSAGPGAEYLLNHAGPTDGDVFGSSLAVGNFNGDSANGHECQDLAIGLPQVGIGLASGAVAVFYGTAASGVQSSSPADDYIDAGWGSLQTVGALAAFGWSVAASYADNDGYADLLVGDMSENAHGAVHVIRGSASGLTDVNNKVWDQSTPNVPGTPEVVDGFGYLLACGDFDGAGAEDVAIYVSNELATAPDQGVVQVLYLSSASAPTIVSGEEWQQSDIGSLATEPEDYFGGVMAASRPIRRKAPAECLM
ncbi:FG-GAP-like repeat-containing protein [Nannocystis sp. RBIL2]|uniref:FG-GAP-like repeat-containing protein n=1 Tax=Nannocystis sp. RBIL2 TaxID=2996788 RepID=UPI0022701E0A|nr:FG-GAP-like repeat-containing protein [Nannocystis sp. RBIL2]MCY1071405.1 FG-GAP-like repeat-containing protein [Nannocystis sp. RBIL2]